MKHVKVARSATKDIVEIWDYISQDSVDTADRVASDIQKAIQMLAEMPGMGHQRADVKDKAYRFWKIYSYLNAYRVEGQTVLISRVLHGARNFRRFFRKIKG